MGKQGRKKQRQKRKQQLRDDPISLKTSGFAANDVNANADADASSTAIVNPHSAVQKLRNPDPKIRHAALVALQASVISQLNCSSRPINIKVLQAVREQVTNNDLECSAVAADCLAQYLSVTSSSSSNKKEGSSSSDEQQQQQQQQHKETTASWALVLLGRLDDCRKALLLASQSEEEGAAALLPQSKNQQKKREKMRKQWYAVSAPCLRALCSLIEDNGPALDRINLQKKTFVEVIFGMLSLEVVTTTTTTAAATAAAAAVKVQLNDEMMTDATEDQRTANSDAIAKELCESTSLYAARCLHSALDDNYELAEVLQHSDNCDAWKTLLSTSNNLSNTTKLHLLGCLVNLYQLSYDPDNYNSSWQEDLLLEYGIASSSSSSSVGLLFTTLFGDDDKQKQQQQQQQQLGNELATLEMDYRTAKALLEKQNEDQRLEEEIDAKVRERKEPAKDIARRQKKDKNAKRQDFQEKQKAKMIADAEKDDNNGNDEDDDDDDNMMMDDVVQEVKQHSGKIIREQNGEEAVNEALGKWNEKIGQIQLALEIVTNLVSTWIVDDNEEDCDMMMGMENSNNNNNKLRNMISTNETTAKSLLVLKNLCHYLRRGKKDSNNPTNNKCYTNWTNERMYEDEDLSGVTPYEEQNDSIRIDIEESISKASACFTNCVLGGCITDPKLSIKMLWFHILSEVFDKGGELYYQQNNNVINSNKNGNSEIVVDDLTSLLVVLSQTHPKYVFDHFLQTDILQWFRHFVARFTKLLPTQANAVPLLNSTILAMTSCISGHDEFKTHVVQEGAELLVSDVTKEFISLLQQDVSNRQKAQIEILRTLMDWYGNDDFYPRLYNALNVSNAITSCLQSISSSAAAAAAAAGVSNDDINDTDIDEEQMTILSNSERFVEYKKQMLQQQQHK